MCHCPQVSLNTGEVREVTRQLVISLGREWDVRDFNQLAAVISHFTFPVFITFLEGRYAQDTESTALDNAVNEIYGNFVDQILKHVSWCASRRNSLLVLMLLT